MISMYFFLSFPMVLLVSQNFSILTSEKHKTCYISKTIFLIFFLPPRSKEEEFLHRYSLFLHRGFLILSRYYSRNTRRSASRRARRASLQSRCAIGAAPLNIIKIFVYKLLNIQIFLTFLVFFNLGNKS